MIIKKLGPKDIQNLLGDIMFVDNTSDIPLESWDLDNFLYDLPEKWNLSRFVFDDDKLVAYVICSKKVDSYHIHRFIVSKHYRNLGLGSLVLGQIIDSIQKSSLLTLKVKKYNDQAISFYEHKGFIRYAEEDVNYLYKKVV